MPVIHVDTHTCTGHAMCAMKAPEIYELDDEGYNASDGRTIADEEVEAAELGVLVCPEKAITLDLGPGA